MARMPGQPIDEFGKTVFPAATEDDDVQGHQFIASDEADDDELTEKKPGPELAV